MPRQARLVPPQGFLHIMCRGNNRRKLFFNQRDFKDYYFLLKRLKGEEGIGIYHYCLMPNHVHLILGVNEKSRLSGFMHRLSLKYSYIYIKKHDYIGHLWQDRFKSKLIERDDYLIQCGKYIELNPVRAGIVFRPEEYRFSSYIHYAFGVEDNIVDDNPLYLGLSNNIERRRRNYRKIVVDSEIVNEAFVTLKK